MFPNYRRLVRIFFGHPRRVTGPSVRLTNLRPGWSTIHKTYGEEARDEVRREAKTRGSFFFFYGLISDLRSQPKDERDA